MKPISENAYAIAIAIAIAPPLPSSRFPSSAYYSWPWFSNNSQRRCYGTDESDDDGNERGSCMAAGEIERRPGSVVVPAASGLGFVCVSAFAVASASASVVACVCGLPPTPVPVSGSGTIGLCVKYARFHPEKGWKDGESMAAVSAPPAPAPASAPATCELVSSTPPPPGNESTMGRSPGGDTPDGICRAKVC